MYQSYGDSDVYIYYKSAMIYKQQWKHLKCLLVFEFLEKSIGLTFADNWNVQKLFLYRISVFSHLYKTKEVNLKARKVHFDNLFSHLKYVILSRF